MNSRFDFKLKVIHSYWVVLIILVFSGCINTGIKKVYINNIPIEVELAVSPQERTKGLMFREQLGENKGMLFVFAQEGIHNFWMKDTKIALDMIWIAQDKRIVDIKTDVLPCEHEPCEILVPKAKARYVLEVNSGFADKYNIKLGSKVRFSFDDRLL